MDSNYRFTKTLKTLINKPFMFFLINLTRFLPWIKQGGILSPIHFNVSVSLNTPRIFLSAINGKMARV